jgi:sensor domain CHASE-containing protein
MHINDDLQTRWWTLEARLVEKFGKKPDLESILFLIGIQEMGGNVKKYSKEQKQDLMHVALCTVLSPSGYYRIAGVDKDGWPHFEQVKPLPVMTLIEQENFIKDHVLLYFQQQEM